MGSGPNWYEIGSKICYAPKVSQFFCRKRISITDLEVSPLVCKNVLIRPEYHAKGVPIEFNLRS